MRFCVLPLILLLYLSGCHQAMISGGGSPVTLGVALSYWRAGDRGEAVRAYVTAAETADDDLSLVMFEVTEDDYIAMSESQRADFDAVSIDLSRDLRAMTRAVIDEKEDGVDISRVRRIEAALRVGRAHAESERVKIGTATGESIIRGLESRGLVRNGEIIRQ